MPTNNTWQTTDIDTNLRDAFGVLGDQPIPLTEYAQRARVNLEKTSDAAALSRLTKELLVQAQEYPTFRKIFMRPTIRHAVGEAIANNDPEGLKKILTNTFEEIEQEVRPEQVREIPGPDFFASDDSREPTITLGSEDRVAQIEQAEKTAKVYIAEQETKHRNEFAKKLTDNFIARSKITITNEQRAQEEARIKSTLLAGWDKYQAEITRQKIQDITKQSPFVQNFSNRDVRRVVTEIDRMAKQISDARERTQQAISDATAAVVTQEVVVQRPDVFIKIAADQSARSYQPIPKIIQRAADVTRATEVFTQPYEEIPPNLSFIAVTPVQKVVAFVVDQLPEQERRNIIEHVVGQIWEKEAVVVAKQYYRAGVVNEQWFWRAVTGQSRAPTTPTLLGKEPVVILPAGEIKPISGVVGAPPTGTPPSTTPTAMLPKKEIKPVAKIAGVPAPFRSPGATLPVKGIQGALANLAALVFRKPIGQATIAYFETIRLDITTSVTTTFQQFYTQLYTSAAHSNNPGLLSFGLSWAGGYVTKKATKAITKEVMKQIGSRAAAEGSTALLTAATGTAVAPGVGTLIGLLIGWGWDLVKGILKKGFQVVKRFFAMGDTKDPEDNLLLVVGAGVILLFFLPIIPLFNFPAFNQSMVDTSLATGLFEENSGGQPGGGTGNFPTGGGTIGETTLSCANIKGIYLSQADPAWGNIAYGLTTGCTIANSACGPTSVTMILHAFGAAATVPAVASQVWAYDIKNNSHPGCWSTVQANLSVLTTEHLAPYLISSWQEADTVLKNCGLIFAWGESHRPDGRKISHFLVITGINWDATGKNVVSYNTLDPAFPQATQNSSTFTVWDMYGARPTTTP